MSLGRRLRYLVAIAVVAWATLPQQVVAASDSPLALSPTDLQILQPLAASDDLAFGGLGFDYANRSVVAWIPTGQRQSPAVLRFVQQANQLATAPSADAKTWSLSLATSNVSLHSLRTIRDRVATVEPWASVARPYLSRWYVNELTEKVHVDVTLITPIVRQLASQTFGDMVELGTRPRDMRMFDRFNDQVPPPGWSGADQIYDGTSLCTAGFAAIPLSNGHSGMLTAGHCYPANDTIWQGVNAMGIITWSQYGNNSQNLDYGYMDATTVADVWTSGANLGTVKAVHTPIRLYDYCIDGAVTAKVYGGDRCIAQLTASDICLTYADGTVVCHLDEYDGDQMQNVVQKGDSGGPVYDKFDGVNVYALGLISGAPASPSYIVDVTRLYPWVTNLFTVKTA